MNVSDSTTSQNTKVKHIHIELLELGAEIGLKGISLKQALDWAEEKKYIDRKNHEDTNLFAEVVRECFKETPRSNEYGENLFILKTEYYFHLIDYQELQEARQASIDANQNAEKAHKSAKCAIYISIAALIISAAISIWQIFSPVSISQHQVKKLTHPTAIIDQKQLDSIADRPLRLDPEQLQIIQGWIELQKPKPMTHPE